jgi:predicted transglutaminase-like cysteine proteinase
MKLRNLAIAVASLALVIPAMGQTQSPVIHQRRDNQQQRIGNGVENGSLTAGEATRLERQETRINKEIKNMKSDGSFTPAERAKVTRQQNRLSNEIYRDKHNARVQPAANNEVNARQRMQQERIGQGIKSGQLTSAEAARLERNQAGINREVNGMRRTNGGALTPGEKRMVNRQQNAASRRIYRQKHDRQVRH